MINRTICDTLEEMRKCYETRNFSYILGLIEEAQTLANRMEAKLYDAREIKHLREMISELEEKKDSLRKQIKKLSIEAEFRKIPIPVSNPEPYDKI